MLLALAACGGGSAATGPAATPGAGSTATATAATGPAATGTGATGIAIDLSQVDACALVDESTVEALTGESGFTTSKSSHASESTCFWGGRFPQYLEVRIFRSNSLADYSLSPNGVSCPSVAVPGVGVEARGGVCAGEQDKVYLVAMDRGLAVQVLVNEPTGGLTPQDLADTVNRVIAGLT